MLWYNSEATSQDGLETHTVGGMSRIRDKCRADGQLSTVRETSMAGSDEGFMQVAGASAATELRRPSSERVEAERRLGVRW